MIIEVEVMLLGLVKAWTGPIGAGEGIPEVGGALTKVQLRFGA